MATKDNSNGLLSKMAKFVRNPTTNWSDLDKAEAEQDSGYSKLALKEIIERKRQNDFVRRREFDYLRKLRRNGPTPNQSLPSRPSFFQSSIASNQDERAMTLRKIDEIEAQMSKQWWKARQEPVVPRAAPTPPLVPHAERRASGVSETKSGFSPTLASEMSPSWESLHTVDYASTQMGQQDPSAGVDPVSTLPLAAFNRPNLPHVDAGTTDFSTSNLFSVDAADAQADPELEEAAIRFANGDDAGAEAGLLSALQASDAAPESADRWAAALFDLYRATGQQSSFDSVAIDYAMRFGRSAPAWFSLPDLLGGIMPATQRPSAAVLPVNRGKVWECPVALDVASMQGLLDCAKSSSEPLHLHWSQLQSITPDAARLMADLFTRWCSEPVLLHMLGFEALDRTLRFFTPPGDKSVEPFWWRLRLDALRILRLQDEFELAALDYCVTFEVSPPPWKEPLCELVHRVSASAPLSDVTRHSDGAHSESATDFSQAVTVHAGVESLPASRVELNGEILGDAAQALDDLQAGLKGADRLVISCSRLIRVDFSAAGSILNWVAVRESEGCHVQFRDVPRLVAAFFNVIGINEHARVVVRNT
jgi:ABC-type transporter Mla MlaB component